MEEKEIAVIGGGAAGLMAALQAAAAGAKVTVWEHQPACGKKILATGNGRCNLTNTHMRPDAYRSRSPEAVEAVLRQFPVKSAMDFFSRLGLHFWERDGWVYPYSRQAKTVRDMLLSEARHLGVRFETQAEIQRISPREPSSAKVPPGDMPQDIISSGKVSSGEIPPGRISLSKLPSGEIPPDGAFPGIPSSRPHPGKKGWELSVGPCTYRADAVILATGSKASNLPGADGSGYALAECLGHRILPVLPALVPLVGKGGYFPQWAGLRMECTASLYVEGKCISRETGEIQLTDYGVSGIPVFQVSRYAVEGISQGKGAELALDFFPAHSARELEGFLAAGKKQAPYKTWLEILQGIFPDKFCQVAIRRARQGGGGGKPRQLARLIKHWRVPIKGWKDYAYAQACMGGVDFSQVNAHTLESRLHKSLYFAGEILDVDGACGGYNLQWAWSSGAVAAMACTRRTHGNKHPCLL